MRHVVVGTAGHIDHGKTSLVKALTGIDTDRLPVEKARGITTELGFARLDLGGRRIAVVDVPGHERFVKHMVAGAWGIDMVLFVVAADDFVAIVCRETALPAADYERAWRRLLGGQQSRGAQCWEGHLPSTPQVIEFC